MTRVVGSCRASKACRPCQRQGETLPDLLGGRCSKQVIISRTDSLERPVLRQPERYSNCDNGYPHSQVAALCNHMSPAALDSKSSLSCDGLGHIMPFEVGSVTNLSCHLQCPSHQAKASARPRALYTHQPQAGSTWVKVLLKHMDHTSTLHMWYVKNAGILFNGI